MKQYKTIGILLGVLLALGAIATWDEWKTEQEDKTKSEEARLVSFDPESVQRIVYSSKKLEDDQSDDPAQLRVVLERTAERRWQIVEPAIAPADEEAVSSLMTTIRDYKYEKVVAEGNFEQYGLAEPTRSIELGFAEGHQPQSTVIKIGDRSAVGYSVYLRIDDSPKVLLGSQYLLISTTKSLHDFRDKSFIKIAPDKFQRLTYKRKGFDAVVLERDQDGFVIAAPATHVADRNDVIDFVDELNALRAQRFFDKPTPEQQAAFSDPGIIVDVIDEAGQETKVSFVYQNGQYLASYDPGTLVVQLPNDVNSKLSKELIDFRDRRIFKFDSANVLEVSVDDETYINIKGSWYSKVDAERVDADTGKPKEGESISPASHVRSLLIDLEFARTKAFIERSDVKLVNLPEGAAHTITLKFKEEVQKPEMVIRLLSKESADTWFADLSGSADVYVLSDSSVDSLKQTTELEEGEAPFESSDVGLPYGDEPFDDELDEGLDEDFEGGGFEEVPTDSME